MLPEIKKRQFTSAYDCNEYYSRKINELIDLNENTKEDISRVNMTVIGEINDLLSNHINPVIMKLSIVNKLIDKNSDIGTFRNTIRILKSLGQTKAFYRALKSTLKRTKIDKEWAQLIYKYSIKKTIERCERLSNDVLSSLIETSNLNVYKAYLESINKSFEEEIAEYYDYKWDDPEVESYFEHIKSCINTYLDSLTKEEADNIQRAKKQYDEARHLRGLAVEEAKQKEKKANMQKLLEDMEICLSVYCNNFMEGIKDEYTLNRYSAKVEEKLLNLGFNRSYKSVSVGCIALYKVHSTTKKFDSKKVKYLGSNGKHCSSPLTSMLFFENLEKESYEKLIEEQKANGYVAIFFVLREATNYCNYLYGINSFVPYDLKKKELEETLKKAFDGYREWNKLNYAWINAVYNLDESDLGEIYYAKSTLSTNWITVRKMYESYLKSAKSEVTAKRILLKISYSYNILKIINMNALIKCNPVFFSYYNKLGGTVNDLFNDVRKNCKNYLSFSKDDLKFYIKHIESTAKSK